MQRNQLVFSFYIPWLQVLGIVSLHWMTVVSVTSCMVVYEKLTFNFPSNKEITPKKLKKIKSHLKALGVGGWHQTHHSLEAQHLQYIVTLKFSIV